MTRTWSPGRAAEAFDRAIEGRGDGAADGDLLAVVSALRALPGPEPRPAHVADLRTRLLDEADRLAALAPAPTPSDATEERLRLRTPSERAPRRRLVVAAGTLAALGVGASVGVAAQTALPGETLYPVKRALESARTGMTVGERDRAQQMLADATGRLDETLAVLRDPDAASTSQIPATLDSFSEQARGAASLLLDEYARTGDRAVVEELRTFTAASSRDLSRMQPTMPESGLAAWGRATDAVGEIDTDALSACPLCAADLRVLSAQVGPSTPDFDPDAVTLPTTPEPTATAPPTGRGGAGDRDGGSGGRGTTSPGGERDGAVEDPAPSSAPSPTPVDPLPEDDGVLGGLLGGNRTSGAGGDGLVGGLLGGSGGSGGGGTSGGGQGSGSGSSGSGSSGSGSGGKDAGGKGAGGAVGDLLDGVGDLLP